MMNWGCLLNPNILLWCFGPPQKQTGLSRLVCSVVQQVAHYANLMWHTMHANTILSMPENVTHLARQFSRFSVEHWEIFHYRRLYLDLLLECYVLGHWSCLLWELITNHNMYAILLTPIGGISHSFTRPPQGFCNLLFLRKTANCLQLYTFCHGAERKYWDV